MKNVLLLCLLILGTMVQAQDILDLDYLDNYDDWYRYEHCLESAIHPEVIQITDTILNALELEQNFKFLHCDDFDNAAAVILPSRDYSDLFAKQDRYIVYDWEYLLEVQRKSESMFSTMAILSHEIGHHLNSDPLSSWGSTPEIELNADRFVGNTICRFGGSLQDAQASYIVMEDSEFSYTHPQRRYRLIAIEQGWKSYWEKHPNQVSESKDREGASTNYDLAMHSEKVKEKIEYLTIAISYDLRFAKAYLERGELLLKEKEYELAESDFTEVVNLEPDNTEALKKLIWVKSTLGKTDITSLLDTYSTHPEISSIAYFLKAKAQKEKGKLDLAESYASKAISLNPNIDLEVYFQRANIRQDLGNHEGALADLNIIILESPLFYKAYKAKGKSLLSLGITNKALENLKVAYEFDRYDEELLLLLATAYFEADEGSKALQYLDRSLYYTQTVEGYLLSAKINIKMNRVLEALNACRYLLEIKPKDEEAIYLLEQIVEKLKK